ncbi:uncharacterized protein conserved in bacteria [Hahella chejuensis KCTC 2396]|uniref:Uncharacterized protein conserved in bacteria n=1 Tax=Hahella chejuensis (strain KCTC 2396) TaxID=349521 RepID=Q2SEB8_HAHCH|nr:type IVB secretion system protein IcmH/DotU [Hahella chejuensis]ABC31006.1 uncharacterized protein conserved in bacteria [Hahella chejuensis KCTC 2396]
MSNDSDKTFFGGAGGSDRTVIVPTPGGRSSGGLSTQPPPTAFAPHQAPTPPPSAVDGGQGLDVKQGLNPLTASASELIALLGELRQTVQVQNPNQLRQQVIQQIRRFESEAQSKGVASDVVLSARYVLCSALDEAIMNTPWGAEVGWSRATLLSTFHRENVGGEKVFLILDKILATPAKYIDLIELIYVCLSLGFEGKYKLDPRGRDYLETIRDNLVRTIQMQRGEFDGDLSPRWRGATPAKKRISEYVPLWVVASIMAAGLLLSYSGFRYWLGTVTDAQEQQLQELTQKYQS